MGVWNASDGGGIREKAAVRLRGGRAGRLGWTSERDDVVPGEGVGDREGDVHASAVQYLVVPVPVALALAVADTVLSTSASVDSS